MKKVKISKEAAFIKKAAESGSFSILNPGRIRTISTKEVPKFSPVKSWTRPLVRPDRVGAPNAWRLLSYSLR